MCGMVAGERGESALKFKASSIYILHFALNNVMFEPDSSEGGVGKSNRRYAASAAGGMILKWRIFVNTVELLANSADSRNSQIWSEFGKALVLSGVSS